MFRCLQIFLFLVIMASSTATVAQPAPKDKFSKRFLRICKDAPARFVKTRGKAVKRGDTTAFVCKRLLPGSKCGTIRNSNAPACIFTFGTFAAQEEAEEQAQQLTTKITDAFLQRAMIKNSEPVPDETVTKRTAIAEMKGDGFSGYNIWNDIIKSKTDPATYTVQLTVNKGQETVYRFIHKNEPVRSRLFTQSFKNIYAQFSGGNDYSCGDILPGFDCSLTDSAGKNELMLEKHTDQFRDAQVEFESLTTSVRATLNGSFLYYTCPVSGKELKKTVFMHFSDLDKTDRRSIATYLMKNDANDYSVRVILYHP